MIRFTCPTCGNALTAKSNKVGSVATCPACNQMVQVPPGAAGGGAPKSGGGGGGGGEDEGRGRREGMRPFWALVRFFLWGICFAAVVLSVVSYFVEIDRKTEPLEKTMVSVQALIYILGSYYLARTFQDASKSFDELVLRLRSKKRG